jgi:hypothetical protein
VTLARLVLEIRERAGTAGHHAPRALALEQAARAVLEPREGDSASLARRILAALLGFDGGPGFNAALLEAMTPDAILLLDTILAAISDLDAISLWRPRGELLH